MTEEQPTSPRRPVFFQIPMNWAEMTEKEKHARSLEFVDAGTAAGSGNFTIQVNKVLTAPNDRHGLLRDQRV